MSLGATLRKLGIELLWVVAFVGSCSTAWWAIAPGRAALIHDVGKDVPPRFPVLVLTSAKPEAVAYVVAYADLDTYKQEFPELTFLPPAAQEARLNEELHRRSGAETHSDNSRERFLQAFRVTEVAPGRQRLRVQGDEHDENTSIGWYEATATTIIPQRFEYHRGPQNYGAILTFPLAAGGTSIAWLVGWIVGKLARRKKKGGISAAPTG